MTIAAEFTIDYLQYLDPSGQLIHPLPSCASPPPLLVKLLKEMLFVRCFDTKAIALQRTGKLGTYPSCLGHEATHVGMGYALQKDDIFAPSYRECASLFLRGVRPRDILLYWGGDERGSDFPRDSAAAHDFPYSVPIATQCLHAAGAALALKLSKKAAIAIASCGDGGSSKTDFYAALNVAGAYTLPLILCIVNNGWAISAPRSLQTSAQTLAQKGIAGGLYCLQADGNDLIAVLEALQRARARAEAGNGARVIEFVTYRLSDHTTADDARRYRDADEVEHAWTLEPMRRLRSYLTTAGHWDDTQEQQWLSDCEKRVDDEIDCYLRTEPQPPHTMFDYLFAQLPPAFAQQRLALLQESRP